MSINTEISRLQTAKSDLKQAIENKGVSVSSSATIDEYADLVGRIEGFKRWVANVPETISTDSTITLVTDQWISDHYNDPNLELIVTCISNPSVSGKDTFFIQNRCRNTPITSSSVYYQLGHRQGYGGNSYSIQLSIKPANAAMNKTGMIGVFSTGEVKLRAGTSWFVASGDYEILARLLP